jgi:diguanylate cyclase (GGDEF)-like protein
MAWFFKKKGSKGTAKDADSLRSALLEFLQYIEGELPRAEAQRVQALLERLQDYPVPTGLPHQASKVVKALRATAVGGGSTDFAAAAMAMVGAMQRVSILDPDVTRGIGEVKKSVPHRVRNADARLIEASAKALEKSAEAARFRQHQAEQAAVALIGALESSLGDAIDSSTILEQQLASVQLRLEGIQDPAVFIAEKESIMASVRAVSESSRGARQKMEQGMARVQELRHNSKQSASSTGSSKSPLSVDSLTQVGDRESFLKFMPMALIEARASGGMLTCMRFNLDEMTRINEEYHQSSGDDVLRTVASEIVRQLRNADFVARIGGDDFAAILPSTGGREAVNAAQRVGAKIRRMIFSHKEATFKVTISIGIATWDGNESAESLYARTEHALKRAKKNGGSQYWVAKTLQQGLAP